VAKAAATAGTLFEFVDLPETGAGNRQQHQLCNTITRLNSKKRFGRDSMC